MRTLGRCFRLSVSNKHSSWVSEVEKINEWINVVEHSSTGFTPYQLHFRENIPRSLTDGFQYPDNLKTLTCNDKIKKAYEQLCLNAEKRKRIKNPRNPLTFNIGDKVLLRVIHQSRALKKEIEKFFDLYEGPYTISKQVGPNAYVLVNNDKKIIGKCNNFLLKPYKKPLI